MIQFQIADSFYSPHAKQGNPFSCKNYVCMHRSFSLHFLNLFWRKKAYDRAFRHLCLVSVVSLLTKNVKTTGRFGTKYKLNFLARRACQALTKHFVGPAEG